MFKIRLACSALLLLLIAHGPALSWSVTTAPRTPVANTANIPYWWLYPDGHLSVLPSGDPNYPWMMFWSEFKSYRTLGTSQTPEGQKLLSPTGPVFGGESTLNRWDNGGSWLYSVHRLPTNNLVGFYHAEDHWYPHVLGGGGNNIAWKSMAVTYSSDNGVTWEPGRQIITSDKPKPAQPTWGGAGDGTVIRDEANQRWVAIYQEHYLYMAISTDPLGQPGTWKKLYNGAFSEPGLGGKATPIANLRDQPGANPSVFWSITLGQWVMVWHGWNGNLYISASPDLMNWETPRLLLSPPAGRRFAYPTVIGRDDRQAYSRPMLYFADMSYEWSDRKFNQARLTFAK